ncbi:MAG: hypothetical protein HY286_01175 [Planctomycetes bacterium]|nr:hypothetical protein [Planctomycetota bacterium]
METVIKRSRALALLLAAIVAAPALTSCVTRIEETHIFQARRSTGEIVYYRLNISGDTHLANSHYRAGLYDAEALDALFDANAKPDPAKPLGDDANEARRREAVAALASAYYATLQNPEKTPEDIKIAFSRYARGLQSPYVLAAAEAGNDHNSIPAPRRKYTVILSAIASEVEKVIADFAENQDTQKAIIQGIAAMKRKNYIRVSSEKQDVDKSAAFLRDLRAEAEDEGLKNETDAAKKKLSLGKMLESASSVR